MKKGTTLRAFRLPADVDASTRKAAKDLGQSQTQIVVQAIRELIRAGVLPQPPRHTQPGQLKLL